MTWCYYISRIWFFSWIGDECLQKVLYCIISWFGVGDLVCYVVILVWFGLLVVVLIWGMENVMLNCIIRWVLCVCSVRCVCLFCGSLFVCLFYAGRAFCALVCVCMCRCAFVCFFLFLDGAAWQGELTIASVRARWSEGDYGVAGVAEGGIYLPFKNSIYWHAYQYFLFLAPYGSDFK